jgi:hypothetical protein
MGIPVDEILRNGIPDRPRPLCSYLEHAFRFDQPDEVDSIWKAVKAHSLADDKLAGEYIAFLLSHRRYDAAVDGWAAYLGKREVDFPRANAIVNGDFESDFTGSPLDWQWSRAEHVSETRDSSTAHAGKSSLRVSFDGTVNIDYAGVHQQVVVSPGPHRLEFWIRTSGITTDQGIAWRLFDPENPSRLDIRTAAFVGTTDWRRVETAFVVHNGTRIVQVQLARQPTWKFDNQIAGTAWLDSLRVTRGF